MYMRNGFIALLAPLGVSASLAVGASAQVTKQKDGRFLLRVRYTQGTTLKFKTVSTSASLAKPLEAPMIMKVTKVTSKSSIIEFTGGGQSVVVEVDSRNNSANGVAAAVGTSLPEKALKVGETWTASSPVPSPASSGSPSMGGAGTVTSRYVFKGLATENGKKVAVITFTMSGQMSGGGTMSLLLSDGTLYSSLVNLNLAAMKISVKSKVTRV